MPITFKCACGQGLKVKDELAGRAVKCPKCGTASKVPAPAAAPDADPEIRIIDEEPAAAPQRPAPAARPRLSSAPPARTRGAAARGGPDVRCVLQGLAGGVAAAVLGAFVWYLLAKGMKAKIGWVAWGIGWATGFGVVVLSGGRGGMILSVIGAGTALLGWLIGEYLIYRGTIPDALQELISFGDYLKHTFGPIDGLFILLAVATGWGVPQKMGSD